MTSPRFGLPNGPIYPGSGVRDNTGINNLGIYTSETTQRFVYGTRFLTWDGRVYKYMGLTTGGAVSYHGVQNTLAAVTGWTAAVAASAGDTSILITDTGIAINQLAGAMVELYKATIDNSTTRHIVGNDVSGSSTTKIFLEAPLSAAMDTNDAVEVFENPYRLVSEASAEYNAWMGIACVTAATLYNIWVQTWGPALVSPGNTSADDPVANERSLYWWNNGTIAEAASNEATSESQHAGYILNQGTGIAGPQIYLMCST